MAACVVCNSASTCTMCAPTIIKTMYMLKNALY